MCTPQFMQGIQAGMAQLQQQQPPGAPAAPGGPMMPGAPGTPGAPVMPGAGPSPATGGLNSLPATAGAAIRLPPGAPPMATAPAPPGGMVTAAGGGAPLPQQVRNPLPGVAPAQGLSAPVQGRPGFPPSPNPQQPQQAAPVGGLPRPGYSPQMPPGAGVRGPMMPPGPQGQLPMRPNALPRRGLRR